MKAFIFIALSVLSIRSFASEQSLVICETNCRVTGGDRTYSQTVHASGLDASVTFSKLEEKCSQLKNEKSATDKELGYFRMATIENSCFLQNDLPTR